MLFHHKLVIALAPAFLMAVVVLVRLTLDKVRGTRSDLRSRLFALGSTLLCGGAALVLRLASFAHAVNRNNPLKVLSPAARELGSWGLDAGIFGWQQGLRIGLTLAGLALAVLAIRHRPRWLGALALAWALASCLELGTTF